MGLRRIRNSNFDYPYTIIDAAKSKLKRSVTYREIANSILIRTIELLESAKVIGRAIVLLGYGDLGSILAERFRTWGVRVVVHDPGILRLIKAVEGGYKTYRDPVMAIDVEKPILIIGVSGYNSITQNMLDVMQDNTYVTAGATADTSIFDVLSNEPQQMLLQITVQF